MLNQTCTEKQTCTAALRLTIYFLLALNFVVTLLNTKIEIAALVNKVQWQSEETTKDCCWFLSYCGYDYMKICCSLLPIATSPDHGLSCLPIYHTVRVFNPTFLLKTLEFVTPE